MRRVYKFPVKMTGPRTEPAVTVPNCVKVVMFGPQGADGLFVWAEVSDDGDTRAFAVVGTGDTLPGGHVHVASCQEGPYAWHLYEGAGR